MSVQHAANCEVAEKISSHCTCDLRDEILHEEIINELHAEIRKLFPLQILGRLSNTSEFGIKYTTLANGLAHLKTPEARSVTGIRQATRLIRNWLENEYNKRQDVLVWRQLPTIETAPTMRLWVRFHTMTKARLIAHITKAGDTITA